MLHLMPTAETLRQAQAPPEFIFLRNYKKKHSDRIERVVAEMRGEANVVTAPVAYDEAGNLLPSKLAVYAANNDVASLFFQFYQQVKSAENSKVSVDFPD